ncbi:MAG TPA: patatin-like phospholipase family protein [Burkholderiaceae bacterium]
MVRASTTGLILTGGGARAAYQVGVLRAIARLRRQAGAPAGNPFPVLAGTSAGAINAAALATGADDFDGAVARLVGVWDQMHVERIYRTDSFGVIRTGARWLTMMSMGWAIARMRRLRPRSMLDNSPLHELLASMIDLSRIDRLIVDGHLVALAVSASSYTSGSHVTFYQAASELLPWVRSNRIAVHGEITLAHLLASAAIPFMFPAMALPLGGITEWFGDGSMRQTAPISPAIHLGADRILVIGAGRMREPPGPRANASVAYPTLAQIGGHALSSIFLDALAVDAERLERINGTLALIPEELRSRATLRPVKLLLISPSERLDDIAGRHVGALPPSIRALLGAIGVTRGAPGSNGAALASYLLFEADYTRELMRLGEADTLARRDEVLAFFGLPAAAPVAHPPTPSHATA